MEEAVRILEEIAKDCDSLKQRCYDSIRKIQRGFYPSAPKGGKMSAADRRKHKIQKDLKSAA